MNIGYCRVSTTDQNLELQQDALSKAGCEKIFEDVASGSKDARSGLQAAVEFAFPRLVSILDIPIRGLRTFIE